MDKTLKNIEKIAKALGDENRLKILEHIARNGGNAYCSTVQECVKLTQPSISHHIKILLEAELIHSEKEGRNHRYFINEKIFNEYQTAVKDLVNF